MDYTSYNIGGNTYKITSVEPEEACCTYLNETRAVAVPNLVTINGTTYEVTSIADGAFHGSEMLETVTVGANIRTIGENAFEGCRNLLSITVSEENQTYSSYDGCLYSRDYSRLICCPPGKQSVQLKAGLSSIGPEAFSGCSKLTSIQIPESVADIEEGAFTDCGEELCIICAEGSVAETYAKKNSIRCQTPQEGKKPQIITAADFVKTVGDAAFPIEARTDGDGELSYESSNESVAVVSAKGTVAVVGAGTAQVTITAAETEEYEAAQKVVTITVNPKSGGSQNPDTGNNNQENPGTKKVQTITAADVTKTYGDKPFPIGAKTGGSGTLSYAVKNPKIAAVDRNGTVTLKSCGITEIVITAAANGEYQAASKTITLTVAPKKLASVSAKSAKAGTLTVKWRIDKTVSGYIIECSTDKKFRKNVKTVTVKKNKAASKKVTKLKKGKKYYIRACAYVQAGDAKIRGAYGTVKKAVKVKK